MTQQTSKGPLTGLKIVEFESIGPGPFAAMLLCDMGADVIRISRHGQIQKGMDSITSRGRKIIQLDLKNEQDKATAKTLCAKADVLIEGFRPQVLERLGLGPEDLHAINPRLIFARMTGWGQTGPKAHLAGHDMNYISITGALAAIGHHSDAAPVPPLNLVGDYAGGSMYLIMGILSALYERQQSGLGQVIDAAMCDGASSIMTMFYDMFAHGMWQNKRHSNLLDGGAPFYSTYRCQDGKDVALGPIEPQFWQLFCEKVERPDWVNSGRTPDQWATFKPELEALFLTKTRQQWCELLEDSDACFSPILDMAEAPGHPHLQARQAFIQLDGITQPAPAPRFSRTPQAHPQSASHLFVEEAIKLWN